MKNKINESPDLLLQEYDFESPKHISKSGIATTLPACSGLPDTDRKIPDLVRPTLH